MFGKVFKDIAGSYRHTTIHLHHQNILVLVVSQGSDAAAQC